ncbi:MAG: hypothetical protein ABH821_00020 [archaeon]
MGKPGKLGKSGKKKYKRTKTRLLNKKKREEVRQEPPEKYFEKVLRPVLERNDLTEYEKTLRKFYQDHNLVQGVNVLVIGKGFGVDSIERGIKKGFFRSTTAEPVDITVIQTSPKDAANINSFKYTLMKACQNTNKVIFIAPVNLFREGQTQLFSIYDLNQVYRTGIKIEEKELVNRQGSKKKLFVGEISLNDRIRKMARIDSAIVKALQERIKRRQLNVKFEKFDRPRIKRIIFNEILKKPRAANGMLAELRIRIERIIDNEVNIMVKERKITENDKNSIRLALKVKYGLPFSIETVQESIKRIQEIF